MKFKDQVLKMFLRMDKRLVLAWEPMPGEALRSPYWHIEAVTWNAVAAERPEIESLTGRLREECR